VLDVMNRDWFVRNFQERDWSENAAGGITLEERDFDPVENVVKVKWIWIRGKDRTEHRIRVKHYSYRTIETELKKRGMKIEACYGDYDGSEFDLDTRRMIVVAVKS